MGEAYLVMPSQSSISKQLYYTDFSNISGSDHSGNWSYHTLASVPTSSFSTAGVVRIAIVFTSGTCVADNDTYGHICAVEMYLGSSSAWSLQPHIYNSTTGNVTTYFVGKSYYPNFSNAANSGVIGYTNLLLRLAIARCTVTGVSGNITVTKLA